MRERAGTVWRMAGGAEQAGGPPDSVAPQLFNRPARNFRSRVTDLTPDDLFPSTKRTIQLDDGEGDGGGGESDEGSGGRRWSNNSRIGARWRRPGCMCHRANIRSWRSRQGAVKSARGAWRIEVGLREGKMADIEQRMPGRWCAERVEIGEEMPEFAVITD